MVKTIREEKDKVLNILPVAIALTIILCLIAFIGCGKESGEDDTYTEKLDYSGVVLDECVRLGEYKGLEIVLESDDISKGESAWAAVVENSEILKYPKGPVEYYIHQAEKSYRHYADEGNMEYSEVLASLGVTEADIENQAKKYVKEDLVQLAILRAENIELTEEEKSRLFDKYVEKYVEDYGYQKNYVLNNLKEEIYNSMLFDKMLEYLMLNNTFIIGE